MSRPDTPPNIYKNGRLKTRDELGLSATNVLLCCPFCGGSDVYLTADSEFTASIKCASCPAMAESGIIDADALIKAWNTRAT